jgi:hypothetical protein
LRFVSVDRLFATMLNILVGLIKASHRRYKNQVLETVRVNLDRLRF